MKMHLALAATALALAACSGSSDKKAADETPASGSPMAAASAPAAPASAAAPGPGDADMVAAGKWSITSSMMGQAVPAVEVCYDKPTSVADARAQQKEAGVTCSEQSFHREGDKLIGHSVCSHDMAGKPTTTTTDMVVTGDLKSAYSMDMTMKIDPAPMPNMSEMTMTIAAKRIGDCDAK